MPLKTRYDSQCEMGVKSNITHVQFDANHACEELHPYTNT